MYKDGKYKDSDDFNHGGSWLDGSHGWWKAVCAFFGDTVTHNEIIDQLMKSLWVTLKNK